MERLQVKLLFGVATPSSVITIVDIASILAVAGHIIILRNNGIYISCWQHCRPHIAPITSSIPQAGRPSATIQRPSKTTIRLKPTQYSAMSKIYEGRRRELGANGGERDDHRAMIVGIAAGCDSDSGWMVMVADSSSSHHRWLSDG